MKKAILILFICLSQVVLAQQKEIEWIGFEELEDSLKTESRPVFVYFYTDWCVYCKKMERNAFKDPKIISKLNRDFYPVKMNAESLKKIQFDGQVFTNEQARTKRNGIHQIPLILASRDDKPISFPVLMVLDENFRVKIKSYDYLTTDKMKLLLKG